MSRSEGAAAAAATGEARTLLARLSGWWPVTAAVTLATLAHAVNMFRAPMYDDDEGLYMQQAWSVATHGKLSPYTYFYDHPPLGWFTIAAWSKLTGGFLAFGESVNSGRVLMLLAHAASAALLYGVARRAGGTKLAAVAAVVVFALAPFQLLFGREVLLDNLAVFWLLLALYLLMPARLTLTGAALSGVAMGIALLNKEIVGLMLPGAALLAWSRLERSGQVKGVAVWLGVALGLAALYPLHALLIGEFFPAGSFLDYKSGPHESLLGGIRYHIDRAHDRGILQAGSEFWHAAHIWWRVDPALVVAAAAAIPAAGLLARRSRDALAFGVMLAVFMLFLARGGAVFDFWLLPAVPLVAVIVGLAVDAVLDPVWRARVARAGPALGRGVAPAGAVLLVVITATALARITTYAHSYDRAFAQNQTAPETEAIAWVQQHVDRSAIIAMDNYAWVDLRPYANAHSFWRIDTEPSIRDGLLHGDGRNIDFIIETPVMSEALAANDGSLTLLAQAVADSNVVARFAQDGEVVTILQVRHPPGLAVR
ncbi:MAG TPA: glycosyltransferase family 39 protein [Dehalococcoidia bacterium]|nr:glycosyltransferase family 39 protein [Dehalococcoidia bacterium]